MNDVINNLVTDRNSVDTYYNISDLNRVETAVQVIGEYMNKIGYAVDITYKSTGEWVVKDLPTDVEMARYLDNLVRIKNQMNKKNLALPQSMSALTYEDANDIEKLLQVIDKTITAIKAQNRRCGIAISGDNSFLTEADLTPYIDYLNVLTWHDNPPTIDEDGIIDLSYAAFVDGILQDL